MGGKGSAPAPPVPAEDNSMAMMQMFMQMMGGMEQQQPQAPVIAETPTVDTTVDIDWRAKQEELNEKMRADYNDQAKDRKGRTDTIHTSPLVEGEEEETDVTSPNLGGEEQIIG